MVSSLSFEYPEHVRFACERCAICCGDTIERSRSILLLRIEAERLAQKTSMSIREFAEKVENCEPYIYRMRKTAQGKCVFLKEKTCSVYALRPLVCRFYPFQLMNTGNGKFIFDYTTECPGIGKGSEMKKAFFAGLFEESADLMERNAGRLE